MDDPVLKLFSASRSRMPDFIKPGRPIKKHIESIMEVIRSGINSTLVGGLDTKIKTALRRSMASKHRDTGTRSYTRRQEESSYPTKLKSSKKVKKVKKVRSIRT